MKAQSSDATRPWLRTRVLLVLAGVSSWTGSAPIAAEGPSQVLEVSAGDLQARFRASSNGIDLDRLWDRPTQRLLATNAAPLFALTLGNTTTQEQPVVTASEGWGETSFRQENDRLTLRWADPVNGSLTGIVVIATATPDARRNALVWDLRVENASTTHAVRQVVFPQLGVPELGENAAVLFPRGPGEVQRGIWRRDFRYRGTYPDGWCAMQFLAAYCEGDEPAGIYLGLHDPRGSTKQIAVTSAPTNRVVRLAFEVPASDYHSAGNDFALGGQAVWHGLRGDWFDAAVVYRDWAREQAAWWPRLGDAGRTDTPHWMRELSAWVMTGGAPADCVPGVKRFRDALGLPVGFHWYNWHQIPFDNDYPHYFPTKTNFAAGVSELQRAGVFVMPYINGRLWDSHDRGADDFAFSKVALPATTKQEDGQPYLESYGSKETNGEPVRLAVMCPTTRLWQDKVQQIVLRLLRDEGTRGVYIDQIAAAAPKLCMDPGHGHPLGGGPWWTQGYWDLLGALRREMPAESMLTTECNGEPFIRWFDGYLTWHWQHDGQVPAFPAVYGGTIQMFGRAYRGGATKDLALRMKAGQQLVYGEQIGWFDPGQAGEPQNLPFLRKVIQTRWNCRRCFYAGEMARPPRLTGAVPKVKADWQWSGEWWVTTDAVLTGAWSIPRERRRVFLFVNVSDQTVKTAWDPCGYGLDEGRWQRRISRDGQPADDPRPFVPAPVMEVDLPPQSTQTWELNYDPATT